MRELVGLRIPVLISTQTVKDKENLGLNVLNIVKYEIKKTYVLNIVK